MPKAYLMVKVYFWKQFQASYFLGVLQASLVADVGAHKICNNIFHN